MDTALRLRMFKEKLEIEIEGQNGLMDAIENAEYDGKFDCVIMVNHAMVRIPMCADVYDDLLGFVDKAIQHMEE